MSASFHRADPSPASDGARICPKCLALMAVAVLLAGCTSHSPEVKNPKVIRNFTFPWSDKAAPRTELSAYSDGMLLHFTFDVDDSDIVIAREWRGESTLDGEDRVELFFATDAALARYWCIEIDPLGRVHDYAASHYRRLDSAWNCPGLRTAARHTGNGYHVEASVPFATLSSLLGTPVGAGTEVRVGFFRAEFHGATRGEVADNWLSWVRPATEQPDFHVPSAFRLWRIP